MALILPKDERRARAAAMSTARASVRADLGVSHGPLFFTVFWAAWVILGIGVELIAVFNKRPGDTLSEHVWEYVTGRRYPVYIPPSAAFAGRIIIMGFLAWLAVHFGFGLS